MLAPEYTSNVGLSGMLPYGSGGIFPDHLIDFPLHTCPYAGLTLEKVALWAKQQFMTVWHRR